MLDKRLKDIFDQQQFEHTLFHDHIQPVLDELTFTTDLHGAREKVEELLLNTSFEHILDNADERIYDNRQTPETIAAEFRRQCHATLSHNDEQRTKAVDSLIQTHPSLQLKPKSLLYTSIIYSHGYTPEALKLAYIYAEKAHKNNTNLALNSAIREQLAKTYDRLQLHKSPSAPQKYGTIYAELDNPTKGLKKNTLIPPYKGYVYNRAQLNEARQQLGIKLLEEQEKKLRLALQSGALKMTTLTKQHHDLVAKNKKGMSRSNQMVCSNCKEPGHISGACMKPRKYQ